MKHPVSENKMKLTLSLPTRERGLKPDGTEEIGEEYPVAPYAGAWIETGKYLSVGSDGNVAPYAGAWIEIVIDI